jgi:hypothetical protein
MKLKRLNSVLGVAFAIAIGGCSGGQSTGVGGALPQDAAGRLALAIPHYVPGAVKSDRHPSQMAPDARKKSALMYVGDWSTNDVYVTEYPSGKSVGTLRASTRRTECASTQRATSISRTITAGASSSTHTAGRAS